MSLHDEDLVPYGSSAAERDRIVARFAAALEETREVPVLTIDCERDEPTSRVHSVVLEDAATRVIADSIGELVERRLRVMKQRLAHFVRSQSRWLYAWSAIDEAWRI